MHHPTPPSWRSDWRVKTIGSRQISGGAAVWCGKHSPLPGPTLVGAAGACSAAGDGFLRAPEVEPNASEKIAGFKDRRDLAPLMLSHLSRGWVRSKVIPERKINERWGLISFSSSSDEVIDWRLWQSSRSGTGSPRVWSRRWNLCRLYLRRHRSLCIVLADRLYAQTHETAAA